MSKQQEFTNKMHSLNSDERQTIKEAQFVKAQSSKKKPSKTESSKTKFSKTKFSKTEPSKTGQLGKESADNKDSIPNQSGMKEWLLIQAQLQLDYASVNDAIVLLELFESAYGDSLSSGLMLCKAWGRTGDIVVLERRIKELLKHPELSKDQAAALYVCLRNARWHQENILGAKKAQAAYRSAIKAKGDVL
ncbi:hypothetical protein [Marinibactrum halimedae]|uniref:Uncharacterized protein n=1 Tax=Marinibactrum halimedae TaxID=1444977 RepID=A0AA37T276_9GAMM|nr:hypothetical protein [Marinibactrum halimedae]MCD9459068.1 hypothetical protein [Marinibactrum halimedae]GLS24669.1 hypothetical protein GCM10007877_03830 [Marinibactrum halimedae]